MNDTPELSTIKYGLIVVDPDTADDDGMMDIIHFVGFWDEPTSIDIESLRKELGEDEEFGLCEIIDRLVILPAPSEIVDLYRNGG